MFDAEHARHIRFLVGALLLAPHVRRISNNVRFGFFVHNFFVGMDGNDRREIEYLLLLNGFFRRGADFQPIEVQCVAT